MTIELEGLPYDLSICKVRDLSEIDLDAEILFVGKTADEVSVVSETAHAPTTTIARDDGWRGFRVRGTLDFSLVGILSEIAATLARGGISIFAVSTYDTDYVLVRRERFDDAMEALARAGYQVS